MTFIVVSLYFLIFVSFFAHEFHKIKAKERESWKRGYQKALLDLETRDYQIMKNKKGDQLTRFYITIENNSEAMR